MYSFSEILPSSLLSRVLSASSREPSWWPAPVRLLKTGSNSLRSSSPDMSLS